MGSVSGVGHWRGPIWQHAGQLATRLLHAFISTVLSSARNGPRAQNLLHPCNPAMAPPGRQRRRGANDVDTLAARQYFEEERLLETLENRGFHVPGLRGLPEAPPQLRLHDLSPPPQRLQRSGPRMPRIKAPPSRGRDKATVAKASASTMLEALSLSDESAHRKRLKQESLVELRYRMKCHELQHETASKYHSMRERLDRHGIFRPESNQLRARTAVQSSLLRQSVSADSLRADARRDVRLGFNAPLDVTRSGATQVHACTALEAMLDEMTCAPAGRRPRPPPMQAPPLAPAARRSAPWPSHGHGHGHGHSS